LPTDDHAAPCTTPALPFPEASATLVPDPSSKEYAATRSLAETMDHAGPALDKVVTRASEPTSATTARGMSRIILVFRVPKGNRRRRRAWMGRPPSR
jgi:hypothetical protein